MGKVWTEFLAQKALEQAGYVYDDTSGGLRWDGPTDGSWAEVPTFVDLEWIANDPEEMGDVALTLIRARADRERRILVAEAVG